MTPLAGRCKAEAAPPVADRGQFEEVDTSALATCLARMLASASVLTRSAQWAVTAR
jgi:hypothetical protein